MIINKDLQLMLDEEKLLENLAKNLNISEINDNSNIKKVADTFNVELRNYVNATNKAISNGFLSSMDNTLLESFGSDHGLYRKKYSTIRLKKEDQALQIELQSDMVFEKEAHNFIPFRKDDVIYQDETFSILTKDDIVFSSTTTIVYPDVDIVLNSSQENYTIPMGASYQVTPAQKDTTSITPFYKVTMNYPIGLALLEEDINDFRLRIFESTYTAQNVTSSLLSTVAKEVPLLERIQTEPLGDGRCIDVIYPYTRDLLEAGRDPLLQSTIIPMIESSLATKMYYQNMIMVAEPTPIYIQVVVDFKEDTPSQTLLDYVAASLNSYYTYESTCRVSDIQSFVIASIPSYNLQKDQVRVNFINPQLSEKYLNLNTEEVINITAGKFLFFYPLEALINETS